MNPIQTTLWTTWNDLAIRSEVHNCLSDILVDVETTVYLQNEIKHMTSQHALQQSMKHHSATMIESQSERKYRDDTNVQLADEMIVEIMMLSKEYEDLLKWKRDNIHKIDDYDRLLQLQKQHEQEQLLWLEEQKDENKKTLMTTTTTAKNDVTSPESSPNDGSSPSDPQVDQVDNNNTLVISSTIDEEIPEYDRKPAAIPSLPSESIATPAVTSDIDPNQESSTPAQDDNGDGTAAITTVDSSPSSEAAGAAAAAAAVVTLEEEEEEDKEISPTLVDLDVEILMTIFGFLDAMDILNMAQINATMYNKIDNIFGITEDGQSPPQPTTSAAQQPPAPAPAPAPVPAPQAPASAPLPPTTTTTTAPVIPRPGTSSTSSVPSSSVSTPTRPTAAASAAAAAAQGHVNRLFSMLQPAKATTTASSNKASPSSPSMTMSAVQTMAEKLNDTEVAAILSMTDKLHRMDKEVQALRQEKETISAQLDGTEAVKQYLISKVREVERTLMQTRDDEMKVAQQIASDQEVIAFLDSRVRELERQTETITKEMSKSQSELSTTKVQTSKKITMLSDMLKYEREKTKEEEGNWKAKKKLLVKEVKKCRAQIVALQAERDGLREQNEMLKRAIMTNSSNNSGAAAAMSMGRNTTTVDRPRGGGSVTSDGSIN